MEKMPLRFWQRMLRENQIMLVSGEIAIKLIKII